jgi:hypothetical protein
MVSKSVGIFITDTSEVAPGRPRGRLWEVLGSWPPPMALRVVQGLTGIPESLTFWSKKRLKVVGNTELPG